MGSNFEELHARYHTPLLLHAGKLCKSTPWVEPEDLVQETLVRFMEQTGKGLFDATGENFIMGWLIKVMTRHFYDLCRTTTSRRKAETDPTITRWTFKSDDVPATYERISQERYEWAVGKLPANQRVTLLLKAEGWDHKEIAHRLEITVGAVAQRLYNARQTLNRLLQPYVEEGVH